MKQIIIENTVNKIWDAAINNRDCSKTNRECSNKIQGLQEFISMKLSKMNAAIKRWECSKQ